MGKRKAKNKRFAIARGAIGQADLIVYRPNAEMALAMVKDRGYALPENATAVEEALSWESAEFPQAKR